MRERHDANMVYTPLQRIPLGLAMKKADGTYALRVKKSHGKDVEDVPLDALISEVIQCAEAEENAESHIT